MLSSIHYLVRSKLDGQYLVARIKPNQGENSKTYLLVFKEDFDALSYLNAHSIDLAPKFVVESLPTNQLKALLQRWGYEGIGLVNDPVEPRIEFFSV